MKRPAAQVPIAVLIDGLSDPIRLRMLRILEQEELAVGEVASVLRLAQSTVSRHLKVLSDARWVIGRNAGTATLYRLVPDDLEPAARELWRPVREQLAGPEYDEDSRRLAGVLAARRMDSQAFFGRIAGEWDHVRARLFGSEFTARALLALLPRHWVIADLGCGTGNASEVLAPHAERIIAIDASEAMLDAARKRLDRATNVEFLAADLARLPLPDASVDAAVCFLVLHHIEEPVAAVRQMHRILRTDRAGGVALIVDMVEHDHKEFRHTMGHKHLGFSADAMEGMLRAAGFRQVEVSLLPIDPDAKGPALFAATARLTDER